jgi:hypothetical protein
LPEPASGNLGPFGSNKRSDSETGFVGQVVSTFARDLSR